MRSTISIRRSHFLVPAGSGQKGFSLIEVLVALVVLSIGLLGLAALQTVGLKLTHGSYERTQATIQAYEIMDRMRANPVGAQAGDYNVTPPTTLSVDCAASTCTPSQLASYDLYQWRTDNAVLLSNGTGTITSNGTVETITMSWTENDMTQTLNFETQL